MKINVNEEKIIKFTVNIQGTNISKVKSNFRLAVENVEYGFPVTIEEGKFKVVIPPLADIINKEFEQGDSVMGKLEVVAEGNYLLPWEGSFQIEKPLKMEASLEDDKVISDNTDFKIIIGEVVEEETPDKSPPEKEKPLKKKSKFRESFNV